MFTPWLTPPPPPDTSLASYTLGARLGAVSARSAVVLIGLDATVADLCRQHLYRCSWDFGTLSLGDLGNIRKSNPEFIIPLLRELYGGGMVPLLLGSTPELLPAQYLAFAELNRQINLLTVDRRILLSAREAQQEALDHAVYRADQRQFHLTHLGSQQHLIDPGLRKVFAARHYELRGLGACRHQLAALEPLLRDADLTSLDIGAIGHYEAPARPGFTPSGFLLQEACQLAWYAGNSDKLSSFGIYGMQCPDKNTTTAQELTAAAYAQLAWYFLYGFSQRQGDFPVSTEGMVEYLVSVANKHELTFWRSRASGRWWVEVPDGRQPGEARHRLVPCAYEDYLQASQQQQIGDHLLMAFRRYAY